MRRVAPRVRSARSGTPSRWAAVGRSRPARCTPGRPGWPVTSPSGCSVQAEAMIRHRTLASLTLATAVGAALVLLVGPLTTNPPEPVGSQAPRSVELPSGRVVPIQAVATGRDGELDVPDDPRTAGWWHGGSRVGDRSGKTLLAAHVDSLHDGLGPYAELYDVRPGLRLVLRSAGLRQDFRVHSVRLIPRRSLTARPDLYS